MAIVSTALRHGSYSESINARNVDTSPGGIESVDNERAASLVRRLRFVLFDVGLDGVLPNDWASPTIHSLAFRALTLPQAEELVRTLEDLAIDRKVKAPTPGPGQLSLLGDDHQ